MSNTELLCLQFTLCYLFTLQINCNNGEKGGFLFRFFFFKKATDDKLRLFTSFEVEISI